MAVASAGYSEYYLAAAMVARMAVMMAGWWVGSMVELMVARLDYGMVERLVEALVAQLAGKLEGELVGNSVVPMAARMGYYLVENSVGTTRVVPMAASTVGAMAELMDLMMVERKAEGMADLSVFPMVDSKESMMVGAMVVL